MSNGPADHRRGLGRWGENLAAAHLQAQGLTIVARNWRCRLGEIDLVAGEAETLVFVEVKTRRSREFGSPEEGLTPKKARKLLELGAQYVADNELGDVEWRIDLVAVEVDGRGNLVRCDHIRHAVLGW